MASGVQPERILRELGELWASLAKAEGGGPSSAGVLRACSMTLIVAAESEDDAANIGQTLGELMHEHPSRAIVLKPAANGDLDARVFAQCWMPAGGRQQICCEQIEIATPDQRVDDVARMIFGLLAPDLPAVLWCRGPRWFELPGFDRMQPLLDKLVLDTCHFPDPQSAFQTMRRLRGRRLRLGDLAWTRLTDWRQMIARASEGAEAAKLDAVRTVEVDHYGEAPSVSNYYLAAWLARALSHAEVTFRRIERGRGQVAGVRLIGDGVNIAFERMEGDTVHVSGSAHMNVVMLPHATDYRSMREELTITGEDRIFEQVYSDAERLAGMGA